jgi:hypothetical protein
VHVKVEHPPQVVAGELAKVRLVPPNEHEGCLW